MVRPLLAGALAVLGLLLRFVPFPPSSGVGLPLPWTSADPEIWHRTNRRLGVLLLAWAGWLGVETVTRFHGSLAADVGAPLLLVVVLAVSHSARLYVNRYHTLRYHRVGEDEELPWPARGGWLWVVVRELLPLATVLVPILVIRGIEASLPDRIPVGFDLAAGPVDWRLRDEALAFLRQQTRFVYLLLLLAEGGYLMVSWVRRSRRDIARRMLTARHWTFFLFRWGCVTLFAGLNLGYAYHALRGDSLGPWVLPGGAVLGLMALAALRQHRRAEYVPPAAPGTGLDPRRGGDGSSGS